ncbi:MAG: glycosyltransferase family 2 protein, partial [Chloroflexi bacterium]|nr:glycosyltransferase family 2 protein [Chloroflexota bacterium]
MTTISIIIPVWNGRHLLPPCLESLRAEQLRDNARPEIIAVDNGSADGSADWIVANAPDVRLLRNRYNLGWSGGCNQGLRTAQGDILVLLNQDTQVESGWLQALERAFDDPRVGIAGCKIHYLDGVTIQHAGAWTEWPLAYGHHVGHHEVDA